MCLRPQLRPMVCLALNFVTYHTKTFFLCALVSFHSSPPIILVLLPLVFLYLVVWADDDTKADTLTLFWLSSTQINEIVYSRDG